MQDDVVWPCLEVNDRILGHHCRFQSILLTLNLSKPFSLEKECKLCIGLTLTVLVVLEVLEWRTKELY